MKQLPPLLAVGLALAAGFALVQLGQAAFASDAADYAIDPGWLLAANGVNVAVGMLGALGFAELGHRLAAHRTAALGARVAGWAMIAQVAIEVGWMVIGCYALVHTEVSLRAQTHVLALAGWIAQLATALGLGLAARRWAIAVPLVAVAGFVNPPWFLAHALWGGAHLGFRALAVLEFAPRAVLGGALLAAAVVACRGTVDAARTTAIAIGLRRAARALWLRAVPVGVLIVLLAGTTRLAVGRPLEVIALVLDAAALAWFAVALAGVVRVGAELPRWPFALAIAAAWWLVGVTAARLPWLYYAWQAPDDIAMSAYGPFAGALQVTCQLVAGAAIAGTVAALRGSGRIVLAVVVLTLASIAVPQWIGWARTPLAIAGVAVAGAAGVVALVLAARAFAAAAAQRETVLPNARVV